MQGLHTINSSYYCRRERSTGPVLVMTTGDYVVAEFSAHTRSLKWHRVVQAAQRAVIEKWLHEHYGAAQ